MTARPSTETIRVLKGMSDAERAAAIESAVAVWRAGGLVAFPTETVYGLGVSAATEQGPRRLATVAPRPAQLPRAAWHTHSAEDAATLLGLTSPIHVRLMRRLAPGPVTFLLERREEDLERIREALGAAPGTVHNGRELAVRIPDHRVARDLLAAAASAGLPVIADGVARSGWGDGTRLKAPAPAGIDLALDDGPARLGKPSTVVRLLAAGGFQVVSVGAVEERYIRKHVERRILFVCTGNTCRSPMAEAIARDVLARRAESADLDERAGAVSTTVRSAGVGASDGITVTPESVDAVRGLGIGGEPAARLASHRSHELTRQALAEADEVYTMTRSHARSVRAMAPPPHARVEVLDPDGEDIPDPIGQTPEVYAQTARRLKEAIEKRLAEPGA